MSRVRPRCDGVSKWLSLVVALGAGCGGTSLPADDADDGGGAEHEADGVADLEDRPEETPDDADGGEPDTPGEDGEPDESAEDAGPDLLGDGYVLDAAGWEGSEYVVHPAPPSACGDGRVDPGEECDDGNRLDGDGCDWQCRSGDGDPPPPPDPAAGDYVPSGEPVPLAGATLREGLRFAGWGQFPLVWTGSEYATAWFESSCLVSPDCGVPVRLRFWRFDATGRRIDAEWALPEVELSGGLDLVWTGSGFGLFFSEGGGFRDSRLWYLRLDVTGKPVGEPVLIEAGGSEMMPAADVGADGTIAVAWSSRGGSSAMPGMLVGVRRIDVDGTPIGPVHVMVDGGWAG
ncbi:MAG: hypothetical protein QME96_16995, partial [Myxococcota bacterium]|nr:hypothetical protein [Myxococcota bacterium]